MATIHVRRLGWAGPVMIRMAHVIIGEARADGSGRFRVEVPRTSSSRYDADLGVVALAPGHGVGWAELVVDDDRPAVDVTLRPEQVIRGRIFDMREGRPARSSPSAPRWT